MRSETRRLMAYSYAHSEAYGYRSPTIACLVRISDYRLRQTTSRATPRSMHVSSVFYNQFELPQESRKLYSFKFNGKAYRITTIPTGQRQCVGIAQCVAEFLSASAANNALVPTCARTTYIDNFRFSSPTRRNVELMVINFKRLCDKYDITLKEDIPTVLKSLDAPYDYLNDKRIRSNSRELQQENAHIRNSAAHCEAHAARDRLQSRAAHEVPHLLCFRIVPLHVAPIN